MQNIEELNVKKLNIEELLNKFSNEVLTAARAFYVWKSIDKMALNFSIKPHQEIGFKTLLIQYQYGIKAKTPKPKWTLPRQKPQRLILLADGSL